MSYHPGAEEKRHDSLPGRHVGDCHYIIEGMGTCIDVCSAQYNDLGQRDAVFEVMGIVILSSNQLIHFTFLAPTVFDSQCLDRILQTQGLCPSPRMRAVLNEKFLTRDKVGQVI